MKKVVIGVVALAFVGASLPSFAVESSSARKERQAQERQAKLNALLPKCVDAYQKGNYDEAIPGCTAIIESKLVSGENLGKIYLYRGSSYEKKDDCKAAMADFDLAQPLIPTDGLVYGMQYLCAAKMKDDARAVAALDEAIKLTPGNTDYVRARCVIRFNAKNLALALPDCEKVVAERPDDAVMWFVVGQIYENDKKNDMAKNAYAKALAIKPDMKEAADGLKRVSGAK